jgi:hypothetical protein
MKKKKILAHQGKFPPVPRLHFRHAVAAREVKAKPLRGGLRPAVTSLAGRRPCLNCDGGSGGNLEENFSDQEMRNQGG